MELYKQFDLTDGRIILSPVNLEYAAGLDCTVNLAEIHPDDLAKAIILPNSYVGNAIVLHLTKDSQEHDCCFIADGEVMVKSGKNNVPLKDYIKHSSKEALKLLLAQLGLQLAIQQTKI